MIYIYNMNNKARRYEPIETWSYVPTNFENNFVMKVFIMKIITK